jgi:SAM-dependent methyltransferase
MDSTDPSELRGYSKSFSVHGASPKAMLWHDYRAAARRYRQLLVDLDLDGKSILDVGCGMGDLLPYIYVRTENFNYLGVDKYSQFIEIAKERYAGHEFRTVDPFIHDIGGTFDVVVLCGALNTNEPNWMENRQRKIRRLFEFANEAVVFNMAGSSVDLPAGKTVAYAKIQDIVEFCYTLTPKIGLRSQYHPKDFTVTLFK